MKRFFYRFQRTSNNASSALLSTRKIITYLLVFVLSAGAFGVGSFFPEQAATEVSAHTDYENELMAAGFPESYLPYLSALHEAHPSWSYVPFQTHLDWATVITNEMVLRRNLVAGYGHSMILSGIDAGYYKTPTSWMSTTLPGAFSWTENKWVVMDGTYWVQASQEAVEYVIDPRNWLTEQNVFMFEQLSYNAEIQTEELLRTMMEDTFMDCDYALILNDEGTPVTYAQTLLDAATTHNVSPVALCARLIQEQGRGERLEDGTYRLQSGYLAAGLATDDDGASFRPATETDEVVYYNFFNIGASGVGQQVVDSGGREAKNLGWTTPYKAILGGASKFTSMYIAIGQDTLYFQKFSVVDPRYYYWKQYMQNLIAPVNEGYRVKSTYANNGLLDAPFSFHIPVYDNMPLIPCTNPSLVSTSTANPNYKLKSISVTGTTIFNQTVNYPLTPSFSLDTDSYGISVPYETNKITLSASAIDGGAVVTGVGSFDLNIGVNEFPIVCQSAYGTKKTYMVTINRAEGSTLIKDLSISTGKVDPEFDMLHLSYEVGAGLEHETGVISYRTDSDYAYVVMRCEGCDVTQKVLVEPETEAPTETETSPETEASTETETPTETESSTESETPTEPEGETDPAGEKETPSETESETESEAETEPVYRDEKVTTVVIGAGKTETPAINLREGEQTIYLDVYPAEGDTTAKTTYVVHIKRYPEATLVTDRILSDNKMSNFTVGQTVEQTLGGFQIFNGTVQIQTATGEQKPADAMLATGDQVVVLGMDGSVSQIYDIVIYGDVSGDGKQDLLDFAYIKNQILRGKGLNNAFHAAADINHDGQVDLMDFALIKNFILRGTAISQS